MAPWFFSGGGLLSGDWLAQPPEWLRCLALRYPMPAPLPGWQVDARFRPVEAVRSAGSLPILLTRVGRERADIADTVTAFTASAQRSGVALDVIDVPDGPHSFDILDHTQRSPDAVTEAMAWVAAGVRKWSRPARASRRGLT